MKRQPTLTTAANLDERHMGKLVRIGRVEGELVGLDTSAHRVILHVLIGTNRLPSLFPLLPGDEVEHWRKEAS